MKGKKKKKKHSMHCKAKSYAKRLSQILSNSNGILFWIYLK